MVEQQQDVFYYLTVTNENYAQPSIAADVAGVRQGVLKGMYPLDASAPERAHVQLLGSGAILGEVLAAAEMLRNDWGVEAAAWSVTSYTELHRDGAAAERNQRLTGERNSAPAYVSSVLARSKGPVIAATDYVRAVPELIRAYVPGRYVTLGTDGFGRSDTRAALRSFFEVDRFSIVVAALKALADDGALPDGKWIEALRRYELENPESASWTR
jgi:pyruvate dehydrogenase E1 component